MLQPAPTTTHAATMSAPNQQQAPLILFDTHSAVSGHLTTSGLSSSDRSLSVGCRSGSSSIPPLRPRYTTGVLDVCDDPRSSAEAVLCSCCLVARMYNMLWQQQPTVDMTCCAVMACFSLCPLPLPCTSVACGTAYVRGMAIDRMDLVEESSVTVCLMSFVCLPCSIAQLYRELSLRRLWPGSIFSNERPYLKITSSPGALAARLPPVMGRVCVDEKNLSSSDKKQRRPSLSLQLPHEDHQAAIAVVNPLLARSSASPPQ